jgi:anti-sigma B factor antagonist
MNELHVTVLPSPADASVTVFRLQGHLDAQTVRQLETHYESETARARHKWIVDLSSLEYISSAGLGSFVGVLSELRSQGGDILFSGLSPKMMKIFKVLGFTRIFKVFDSEADALAAFLRP